MPIIITQLESVGSPLHIFGIAGQSCHFEMMKFHINILLPLQLKITYCYSVLLFSIELLFSTEEVSWLIIINVLNVIARYIKKMSQCVAL